MSKLFSINWFDLGKGLIVTIFTTFISSLISFLDTLQLPNIQDFRHILLAGVAAGSSYLLKNFFTNSQGQIAIKE